VPAPGLWLITDPDGTVVLDAWVIDPTARPAALSAAAAALCVALTTLGTATGGGPVEMTRLTAVPGETSVPATGFCAITAPDGTDALDPLVIVPVVNPALLSAIDAAD
jgi:hypothetical protein